MARVSDNPQPDGNGWLGRIPTGIVLALMAVLAVAAVAGAEFQIAVLDALAEQNVNRLVLEAGTAMG